MTTPLTNISALTSGMIAGGNAAAQGAGLAGFEALLSAFFGAAGMPVASGQSATPLSLTPGPATPVLLNGQPIQPKTQADAPQVAEAQATVDPTVTVAAPMVSDILAPVTAKETDGKAADAKTDPDTDKAEAAVDPTLLVDVAALVAQPAPVALKIVATQPLSVEPRAQKIDPQAPANAVAPTAPQPVAAAEPQAAYVNDAPTVQAETAAPAARVAETAPATPASAPAQTEPKAAKAAPEQAPAFGRGKTKGAPAAPALAHANPHARLEEKAAAAELAALDASEGPEPTQHAPAPKAAAPATPAAPEATKAPTAPTRAPQAPAATTTRADAAPTPAPAAQADLPELPELPAAVAAITGAVVEQTTDDAAQQQPAAQAIAAAAQDVTANVATKPAAVASRPRDKAPAKAGDVAKADAKDGAVQVFAPATHKPQAAAAASQPTVERVEHKDAEADAPAAAAHVQAEEVHGPVQEERPAETARASAPSQHAGHVVRGSPETVANLAAQIAKKLGGKTTRFDIELTPQGMGTVDVRIEIQNGRVTAAMTFDNPQAAAELKARAAELQRSLEQAGFDLSGGLSFEARDGDSAGRGWRQAQDDNNGRGMRGQAFRNAFDTATEAADVAESGALRLRQGLNAGLDVRV